MNKVTKGVKDIFVSKNFLLFILIGIVNTFNGTLASSVLSNWLQPNLAFVIGYMFGLVIAYILNSKFNFKERMSYEKLIKFAISYIPNFLIQNIVVIITYNIFGIDKVISYMVAAIIGVPITYLFIKFYAFKENKEETVKYKILSMDWFNSHIALLYLSVFMFFVFFACISNWSILIGENLMKYDIWDAEYPLQVLMSDALASNTIPIWNPLMQYGTPYYAIMGMPVWYPITLVLALFGYAPNTVAISYIVHIAIGGFGMFLLAKQHLCEENSYVSKTAIFSSLIIGIVYCGSGVFLSNAQHIMIIISAAWIPYVFFFMRRYIKDGKIFFGMLAGGCAGLILLGGYPELFYNLFLFLLLFTIYYKWQNNNSCIKNIFSALLSYVTVCIFTVMSAAIVMVPFVNNIGLTSRANGLGQKPMNIPFYSIVSFFMPGSAYLVSNIEQSMMNFYMSILFIILIPLCLRIKDKHKKFNTIMAICAFVLCFGGEMPIHSIMYRFFPMYDRFRFPSLNRVFVVIFFSLVVVRVIQELINGEREEQLTLYIGRLLKIISVIFITLLLVGRLFEDKTQIDLDKCLTVAKMLGISLLFVGLYYVLFSNFKVIKQTLRAYYLFGIIIVEALTFGYLETPISIARYSQTAYSNDQMVKDAIDKEFNENKTRNSSVNFSKQPRSTSGKNSKVIAFNKTFDEEGYLSYRLQSIDDFKITYRRSIMEENPVIFFTNNIITPSVMSYEEWINACDSEPEQIFVEREQDNVDCKTQKFEERVIWEKSLDITNDNNKLVVNDTVGSTERKTGRVRLYFSEQVNISNIELKISFTRSDDFVQEYEGEFVVSENERGNYVDVFFPEVDKLYSSVAITSDGTIMDSADLVVVERMNEDRYVQVHSFGFNDINMTVNADCAGYLTILQSKHFGWTAYVDGKEKEIELVDGCFMGIFLEEGTHQIVMEFKPYDFYVGILISTVYLVILVIAGVVYCKKYIKENAKV